ncbi:hypothetical protein CPB85DRAFT_1335654 [Mucidula mucida]|nr:hypothetical protein CPB85DRAFT_1335654 [Mucidula mucida]
MHVAGKTDQAKADLGRLAKIKAKRREAAHLRGAYNTLSSLKSIPHLSLPPLRSASQSRMKKRSL